MRDLRDLDNMLKQLAMGAEIGDSKHGQSLPSVTVNGCAVLVFGNVTNNGPVMIFKPDMAHGMTPEAQAEQGDPGERR